MRAAELTGQSITAEQIRLQLIESGIATMPLNIITRAADLGLTDDDMDRIVNELAEARVRH
jgi:hypothetical protein